MDEKEIKIFWDEAYGHNDPVIIKKEDCLASDNLDKLLLEYSKDAKYILDYGCGITYNLFLLYYNNQNLVKAIGIDPSSNAIDFLKSSAIATKIDNHIDFINGDLEELKKLKSSSLDFVICMNVLDCILETTRDDIFTEFNRVLKKDGILFFKVNFFLNEKEAKDFKLEKLDEHNYAQNGKFRIAFYEDDYWIKSFEKNGFLLIKKDLYKRNIHLPADRIFIFKK